MFKDEDQLKQLMEKITPLEQQLKALNVRVKVDNSDKQTPGYKFADYELKGMPIRLALGMRDLENQTIEVARRDTLTKETKNLDGIVDYIANLLEEIQQNVYKKALDFRIQNTREIDDYETFKKEIVKGGFLLCHWDGTPETEEKIKAETKATIRCIPLEPLPGHDNKPGKCLVTGKPSKQRVVFAIAY